MYWGDGESGVVVVMDTTSPTSSDRRRRAFTFGVSGEGGGLREGQSSTVIVRLPLDTVTSDTNVQVLADAEGKYSWNSYGSDDDDDDDDEVEEEERELEEGFIRRPYGVKIPWPPAE